MRYKKDYNNSNGTSSDINGNCRRKGNGRSSPAQGPMESHVSVGGWSRLFPLITAGLATVLYWNTLEADFAYDDSRAIKTNPDLLPSSPLRGLFSNDFWGTPLTHSGSHKSYRPLCVLSFRLNYLWSEFNPRAYHLTNVVLHAVVTALFTYAARRFLRSDFSTLVASFAFAAHPIHTEAVAGIVGRADIVACFFFLLTVISYVHYTEVRERLSVFRFLWLGLSLMFASCSMLTKEHGITVLAVCGIYDCFISHKIPPSKLRQLNLSKCKNLFEGLFALSVCLVTLLSVRLHLMGSKTPDFAPADNPASDSDRILTRVLTFSYLPAFNFILLLFPRWLSFDWSMESIPLITSVLDLRNLMSLTFYFGGYKLFSFVWRTLDMGSSPVVDTPESNCDIIGKMCNNNYYSRKSVKGDSTSQCFEYTYEYIKSVRTKTAFCADDARAVASSRHLEAVIVSLSFLILPFVPATNLFFYVGFVIAERVLYISSMGFCLLVGLGSQMLYQHRSRFRKLVLVAISIMLVSYSVRTVRRNRDWLNEENLYKSGIYVNPPKAYGNLANILSAQGKKTEAEWAYKKALTYRSNMADVHYNLGILVQEQKRYEEAIQCYRFAIQFRPRMAMAHLNLGLVLSIVGRKYEAIEVYRHCSHIDGTGLKDPRTHENTKISALFNLGRLYADDNRYEEAIEVYLEAVKRMPAHYQPQSLYNMLGEAYYKLGKYAEAEWWYKEALRVKPDHIPAHLTYGKLLSKIENRHKEAEQWFHHAKSLAPNDSSVYQHYGQFLSETERHIEAAEQYIRAAELAPDEYEIIFNTANTLRQAGKNQLAEKYYRMAVRIKPNEAASHMNLGAMLHVNGKLHDAEQSYLKALELKPDDQITDNNLSKLRNLIARKEAITAARQANTFNEGR